MCLSYVYNKLLTYLLTYRFKSQFSLNHEQSTIVAHLRAWNSLPPDVCSAQSVDSFKMHLLWLCTDFASTDFCTALRSSLQGDHLSRKPGNVRKFDSCQGNVRDFTKVREMPVKKAGVGGAVGSVAVCAAWLQWSASLGSRPRLARSLCQVIVAHALRLNSRAGRVRLWPL